MTVVEEFEFLINGNELAIVADIQVINIKNLRWDGKNVIIADTDGYDSFAFINILPNIRDMLENTKTLMFIFRNDNEVVEAFDVELIKDASLEFDDLFNDGAISCYKKLEELKKNS